MDFTGNRKRKKKVSLGRTPTTPDGQDLANNKELPAKVRKKDPKKSGQTGQVLPDNEGTKNIPFLKTIQKKCGKLVLYIRNQAANILKRLIAREKKSATVGPTRITNTKGNESIAEEEGTGKKRKREDPAAIQDDVSGECSGPSNKQIKTTVPLTRDMFIFHSILGEGGYGKVMLATDKIRRESVALKIIKKKSLISYPECLVEQHVLKITHNSRFLTHCHAAFQTENHAYFVTELASGGDLHDYLYSTIPLRDSIVFMAAEIVCGLQFLHTNGIIHRDIKPDNILLTGDGHIKITDFGLCLCESDERFNASVFSGTPGYGAPEMIMGDFYDAGVDWFAFGVVLYNMILQDSPFDGDTSEEVENNVICHEPSYEDLTDHAAADIMFRLLCKDQSVRLGVNGKIRNHPFFSNLSWTDIETGKAPSPVIVEKNMDVSMRQRIPAPCSEELSEPIPVEEQGLFTNFPFVAPAWSTTYH
ncbi:protein kinase C delta type-like [Ranitomeya variabilis]|uniref:protein kinase C delta type-like n=1 Tax=Ranitomeya variabilis TaxID=490064 RepID=UPI0040579073